jgi:hypothetical protein
LLARTERRRAVDDPAAAQSSTYQKGDCSHALPKLEPVILAFARQKVLSNA